jgi:hypothetical protein
MTLSELNKKKLLKESNVAFAMSKKLRKVEIAKIIKEGSSWSIKT